MGVSAPTLISWLGRDDAATVTASTIECLAEPTYQAIARARYWRSLGCDALSAAVAMMVFDFGWNTGVGNSGRLLQRTIGLAGDLIDGDIGPTTVAALATPRWTTIAPHLSHAAVVELQNQIGVPPDGSLGAHTIAALDRRPALWRLGLTMALGQAQIASYQALANFPIFGHGWVSRSERRISAARALLAS
jgi:lysozyme family protein